MSRFTCFRLAMAAVACCCHLILAWNAQADPVIIDHRHTDITQIPQAAIVQAKASLHIAYGHTSHGSQITTGMSGLVAFANGGGLGLSLPQHIFAWNNGGADSALDLHDYAMGGDVGYYPDWVNNTRTYLNNPANADVNVIIWSWCGQASGYSEQQMIDDYLTPMTQLEVEYPHVTFVYMTGHADGSGESGNLHLRNQQIRNYCMANDKVLYDFYDIEIYDPDGNYYGDKAVNDACDYDSDGNGSRDANWAIQWQSSHTEGMDWYTCSSAHSQPLNANRKAYAAWWLWCTLAGWDSTGVTVDRDGDGYAENQGDCNDGDSTIHPNAVEICGDAIDQNCSGADLACNDTEIFTFGDEEIVVAVTAGSLALNEAGVTLPQELDFFYPPMDIEIRGIAVGTTVDITIDLPTAALEEASVYKLINGTWGNIDSRCQFNAQRTQVSFQVTDGGWGDNDNSANGQISDPVGIAKAAAPSQSTTGGGSGGGGGCFINSLF